MAIYHLKVQVLSRSAGKSAVAASAYRSASLLKDERQKVVFDYSKKQGIAYSKIFAPENAPDWVMNREVLWNQVELAEKRINSQVAREIEIAIPVELTKAQGIKLAEEFVKREFVSKGMIADVNIHRDNPENPHAHILLTTREISKEGFTVKNRSWNNREHLQEWRRSWAEIANEHLRAAGFEVSIDHRSNKAQGIDLCPSIHLGPLLHGVLQKAGREVGMVDLEKYDRLTKYQSIAAENAERIIDNPDIALNALTAQQAVFTDNDIYKFVNRNSLTQRQYYEIIGAIKSSPNIIKLAETDRGKVIYTSREMVELEAKLIQTAIELNKAKGHLVDGKYLEQALYGNWLQRLIAKPKLTLNEGQIKSLNHVLKKGDLKIVIGFAGTGKSTMLGIARKAWEGQGYRVLGTALSGIAAQNLQESGIQSRTIDSLLLGLERNTLELSSQDIVVVDEAGMVNSQRLADLLLVTQAARAKVVLIGDPEQLQPIQAGAPFRSIAERVGYSELSEIVRQQDPLMRLASQEFATQKTGEALARYKKLEAIFEHKTKYDAINAIIDSWRKAKDKSIMLAYTRKDVAALNEKAREILKSEKVLKYEQMLKVQNREGEEFNKSFAINDRVYFIRNDNLLGVKNGSLGKIQNIRSNNLTVFLDTGKTVVFNLSDYNSIDHGYAATIHKAQGITVNKTFLLADKYLDRHSTYVAATRHRDSLEIHYDRETFKYSQDFIPTLSRQRTKDMVVDYADIRDLPNILEANAAKEKESFIKVDQALEQKLTKYFALQIELSRLEELKFGIKDLNQANKHSQEISTLYKELTQEARAISKAIKNNPEFQKSTESYEQISLYDRGGPEKLKERLERGQFLLQDMVAIASSVDIYSKDLSRTKQHSLDLEKDRDISR